MSNEQQRRASLVYHAKPEPGKIKVVPSKNYDTQRDLALAYSQVLQYRVKKLITQRQMFINTRTKETLLQ